VPDVAVHRLTPERWDDAVMVFGTRGDPARCWCQWFRMRSSAWEDSRTATNKAALQAQTDDGPPPGLLAYVDAEPAGWVAVAPRAGYERLQHSPKVLRTVGEDLDDDSVWAVTCFVVRTGFRRQGIAVALLDAAVAFARKHGARVVEGYPVDVASRTSVSSSELFHGSLTLFTGAGFTEVGRYGSAGPVVRLGL
jgi:ribosomal protein S18 acetylase RimI-like enzyme